MGRWEPGGSARTSGFEADSSSADWFVIDVGNAGRLLLPRRRWSAEGLSGSSGYLSIGERSLRPGDWECSPQMFAGGQIQTDEFL